MNYRPWVQGKATKMANSSLVNVTVKAHSGNYSSSSYRLPITNITLHHMAGVLTAKQCGDIFAKAGRGGSAHYGVGSDGKIGLYVDEADVAWHAGNWAQNRKSIGIEMSNSATGGDWPVSDQTIVLTIKLVADIMKRHNIAKAVVGETLTYHSQFAQTQCPGNYVRSKMQYIADEVNKLLAGGSSTPSTPSNGGSSNSGSTSDSFFPSKGYWRTGDSDARIGKLASFMYKTFPAYTDRKALGNYYGPYLTASIREFQRRLKAEGKYNDTVDGFTGPKTLALLKQFGFKY